jgi:hypothetical protein
MVTDPQNHPISSVPSIIGIRVSKIIGAHRTIRRNQMYMHPATVIVSKAGGA